MTAGAVAVPTIIPLRMPVPGQHKSRIDSATKIEISSDTQDVLIYYTINGTKPEPFQTLTPAAKCTFKYRGPFRLPSGKKIVKAIAVTEDGLRESFVVTKTFDVEHSEAEPEPNEEDGLHFINDLHGNDSARRDLSKMSNKMMTSKQAWDEVQKMKRTEHMMQEMSMVGSGGGTRPGIGTRYSDRLNSTAPGDMNGLHHGGDMAFTRRRPPPDSGSQALRLQRETDFLKCMYCFAPRPTDPYARFCNECGNSMPALPTHRIAPPEAGQLGACPQCRSMVPFNTPNCLICEAPIGPDNQRMGGSVRLQEKLFCGTCGTANPNNLTTCVTCEARLPTIPKQTMFPGSGAPVMPKQDGRMQTCTKCGRVNNSDARFCDWCGAKPAQVACKVSCSKCGANNQPYAGFCGACGIHLEPPPRDVWVGGFQMSITDNGRTTTQAQWLPVNHAGAPVIKATVATQTVGLFYPSTRELDRQREKDEEKIAMEKQMRDRKPLLTAVSPGRGYWRKQLEHVCSHLKAEASNNAEFRSLIGEPRMGKILSTDVEESEYEVSLNVAFALRSNKDGYTGRSTDLGSSSYIRPRTASIASYGSQESLESGASTTRSGKGRRKRIAKKKTPRKKDVIEVTEENRKLLKEVGKSGEGRREEVQGLLDEGADANCTNKTGVPVLHVAVLNKQLEGVEALIEGGAEVNQKGPNKGNTALHEAVSLGNAGSDIINALLDAKANSQKKNDKGETAYDLAVKAGHEAVGRTLAQSLGQTALSKLTKPRQSTDDADF